MGIYLNNAATSWPKPAEVAEAMSKFLLQGGANLARGANSERDLETLNFVLDCRFKLAEFFNGYEDQDPRYITFTSNITEALNIVLRGYSDYIAQRRKAVPGMKVLTSSMEHNAVMRPLRFLEQQGVILKVLPCEPDGFLKPELLERELKFNKYDLMVMSHASNVSGTVQDVERIAEICKLNKLNLVLDTAQTAGVLKLDVKKLNLAALCFTGHKGLMGPQGTGGVVWRPDFAAEVTPIISGGTGSFSHLEYQPEDLPDKFESGTPNLPGIAGLNAALTWLNETGIEKIAAREHELGEYFLNKIKNFKNLKLSGKQDMTGRLAVFSINFDNYDNGVLADELSRLGFETRPGLHCSPSAHKTLNTFPGGSLRVSFGYFNNFDEIDKFIDALNKILGADN